MKKLVLLAAVICLAACKSESSRKANNAADHVLEQREELTEGSKEVAKESSELMKAEETFAFRRQARVQVLRATHSAVGTQPMLISMMSANFDLTDAGRAAINERLTTFQRRLDEAANLIQGLQGVDAAEWEVRDEAVSEAMQKLEDARQAAWGALEDAPRVDRSAS